MTRCPRSRPWVLAAVVGPALLAAMALALSEVPHAPPEAFERLVRVSGIDAPRFDPRIALPWPHRAIVVGPTWIPAALPLCAAACAFVLGGVWAATRRRFGPSLGAAAALTPGGLEALVALVILAATSVAATIMVAPPDVFSIVSVVPITFVACAASSAAVFAPLSMLTRTQSAKGPTRPSQ